ncbi:MAG: acetolactate synthase small subunit [Anaerolineae bacterium]|jgi:acetolactate synthase-1/3 small subunit|nr:acetolactate synthase small subunit [Anaerolineae bacterium]MBT3714289.1 acetolactate synthase small subunit [Anaerolineae bacterium]MBT4309008.1 acetolactate synthase small subunit [Anaerolineae bacterium]MBT4459349.1 acetolactate synthase small subunit [Anaerolineae bacterium]MBT6062273.1 acetolactate synthase small subunit [Anaerolineae bacterium]
MQNTLVALVEDKPGVLNRVASLFRRRNFNIKSLNVGNSEKPGVSRMTIVVDDSVNASQVEANLYKLVNIIDVQDVTDQPAVIRELALIKVSATPEKRNEVSSLADIFRTNVVDVSQDSMTVEIVGTEKKIAGFIELLRPFGILEMVRTGNIAMMRGDMAGKRYMPGMNGKKEQKEYSALSF